jgi:hypothetical protein
MLLPEKLLHLCHYADEKRQVQSVAPVTHFWRGRRSPARRFSHPASVCHMDLEKSVIESGENRYGFVMQCKTLLSRDFYIDCYIQELAVAQKNRARFFLNSGLL